MTAGFASEGTFSDSPALIVGPDDPMTRSITLQSGQNLIRGAVLGKIDDTSGKTYLRSVAAAGDGSQSAVAILAEDCDASLADKTTIAYMGGVFDENALNYGAGHTAATVRESLRDLGIKLQPSMRVY